MRTDWLQQRGFVFHSNIEVARDKKDRPLACVDVYKRSASASVAQPHQWGFGPFCKLRVPELVRASGVYAFCRRERVLLIGETGDLKQRLGSRGYATISPGNCFASGQRTNCKVSHLILREAMAGLSTSVWINWTDDYKALEASMFQEYKPPWNAITSPPAGLGPFPPVA
jgi:hypothetical protein